MIKSLKSQIDEKDTKIDNFQEIQGNYKSQRKIDFLITENETNPGSDRGKPLFDRDVEYLQKQQVLVDNMKKLEPSFIKEVLFLTNQLQKQ